MFRGGGIRSKNMQPQPDRAEPLCTKVYVVYGDSEEFAMERRMLWMEVLPELQNFAFNSGFDLEWIDPLSDRDQFSEEMLEEMMNDILEESSWLICLLGEKYGSVGPPVRITTKEFDAIRAAVFEQSTDLKLLDQHYVLDRSSAEEEYRLNTYLEDPKQRRKLSKVVQKGAQNAFIGSQLTPDRQRQFFWSSLHKVAAIAIERNCRCTIVLRKFDGVHPNTGSNLTYCEKRPEAAEKIAALKNQISEKVDSKLVFSHIFTPDNGDIGGFFTSRDADKYRDVLQRQISERLKTHLVLLHPSVPSSPCSPEDIAADERYAHIYFYKERSKRPWYARKEMDSKLSELLGSAANGGGVFLLQGPELCGKTQALCHLYDQAPATSLKIIRFVDLTYSSVFAHEVWRQINFELCSLTAKDPRSVISAFKLEEQLEIFDELLTNLSEMVYLFLDDVHLLKYGPFMSTIGRRLHKAPSSLALFMTASNVSPISSIYTITQTLNLDVPSDADIIEILKRSVVNRNVSSAQWSTIKQQLIGNNCNILFGQALLDQILLRKNGVMSGGIQGRLERIEAELGALSVQSLCSYIVLATHGLTRLELFDLLSNKVDLMARLSVTIAFPSLLLDRIIGALGSLLLKNYVDRRIVYRLSHGCLVGIFRARYFSTLLDLKITHSEIADYFGCASSADDNVSPRNDISYQVFPQQMNRENGACNIRRLHNLWFHLLHTGNMDALKDMALCQFDFIDSAVRTCSMVHLLSIYSDCAMQVLHHDIQVLCEQVLIPAIPTVLRDREQLAAEVIGRLRYTRAENSHFLNTLVEQAMTWVDNYSRQPLLVPLSCWIAPPQMRTCRTFTIKDWKAGQTVLAPTFNHQHVLISGNQSTVGLIYMYHIAAQSLMTTFSGHTGNVTSLSCSTSGTFFVSTSTDKSVRIWSLITGECIRVLTPHSHKVICSVLASDDSFLVTGSADSSAKMIDLESGEVLRSFTEHTGSVVSLQLTVNNEFLITGSGDFIVQMWSLETGRCISRMGGLMAPVSCIAITSNDAFVVVACEDETLRVFSTVAAQELHELMGHEGRVNALACAQDDCQLFAATKSKVYCYDIHNGQIVDVLDCQLPYAVFNIKISSDNFFLFSGCGPRVDVWHIQKRVHDAPDASGHMGFVTAIALSGDDKIAACGTYDGIVAVWDLDICQCLSTVPQCKGIPVSCLAFSFNQTFLLSGNAIGTVSVFDCSSGSLHRTFSLHSSEIVSICPLENYRVLSCDKEGKLCQWEIFGDEESMVMMTQGVAPPIFAPPNGKLVVAHCPKNTKEMKVWTVGEEGPVLKNKLSHNEEITCFAAIALGTLVATGSSDQSCKLWQIDSGYLTQVLVGHEGKVTCVALADDERLVISGAEDRKVIVWSVSTGDISHSLACSAPLTAVSLSSDGCVTFSASEDGWLESWSTENGNLLSSFNAHRPIRQVLNSLDANRLLVQLSSCAQLPILCLHNSPASSHPQTQRRRSARSHSITSLGNDNAGPSVEPKAREVSNSLSQVGNGQLPPPRSAQLRPTFDKLDRDHSRPPVIEKDRSTTMTGAAPAAQKSHLCTIL
ncbi:WD domain G-beta repeat protein [Trichostrongylus colubriformis]|uniref:WD domain G-beta repeat protein n=1 Tax=Trichostrongylus colubriformis TaxID=6319 RepID=A0AAN8IAB1_TRICO